MEMFPQTLGQYCWTWWEKSWLHIKMDCHQTYQTNQQSHSLTPLTHSPTASFHPNGGALEIDTSLLMCETHEQRKGLPTAVKSHGDIPL
ncbi:Hypp3513 [Branchiostoma lanceolatum]|uniref:Hypp3513 protein n=1 Tax=Branchiostoma lanceolatum TaxID=7740 RepID=A0A8K0EUM8_BRALA|nr:Hypp3513 [Branchiostoma lanceolatum]